MITPTSELQSISSTHPIHAPSNSKASRVILLGSIYSFLLLNCLWRSDRNERAIEKQYGLPPSIQNLIGYRADPVLPSPRLMEQYEAAHSQHERLDQLSDEEFIDWLTFEKERLNPRPPKPVDPYTFIEHELNIRFGHFKDIPGLYVDGNTLKIRTFTQGCIIVPCRKFGLICALQIYPQPSNASFFWYSTPRAHGGASVRASIHIANEHRVATDHVALVVSHTIAADAEAWMSHRCVVAVNNISPMRFLREMRATLPKIRGIAVYAECGESLIRILKENYPRVRIID